MELKFPLAVAVHDAGAANITMGIVRALLQTPHAGKIRVAAQGPAADIFAREIPSLPLETDDSAIDHVLNGAACLLSGTSGRSMLEHSARQTSRALGIPSIAVLDHWVNYALRFERDGQRVLPDELWVTDEFALQIARSIFPETPALRVENPYLDGIVREILQKSAASASGALRIAYVLEPIAQEFEALDHLIQKLPALTRGQAAEIRLRPHPSEPAAKYQSWINQHSESKVSIDRSSTLAEFLAWADVVVGCESYAMAIALAAGKRTLTSLPSGRSACRLPQPGIGALSELGT